VRNHSLQTLFEQLSQERAKLATLQTQLADAHGVIASLRAEIFVRQEIVNVHAFSDICDGLLRISHGVVKGVVCHSPQSLTEQLKSMTSTSDSQSADLVTRQQQIDAQVRLELKNGMFACVSSNQ
jgi:hypothetical protein